MESSQMLRFPAGVVMSKGEIDRRLVETLQRKATMKSNGGGYITSEYKKGEYTVVKVTQLYNLEGVNFFKLLWVLISKGAQLLVAKIFGIHTVVDVYIDDRKYYEISHTPELDLVIK